MKRTAQKFRSKKSFNVAKMGKRSDSIDLVTLYDILNEVGLTERQYLKFGVIWREFGSRDLRASCRKMDQFIFFDDILEFVNAICRVWGAPTVDFGKFYRCSLILLFAVIKTIQTFKRRSLVGAFH